MLDQVWLWFRELPFWAQAAGWILGFWLLIPLQIWRTTWSLQWKAGLTAALVLFFALVGNSNTGTQPANDSIEGPPALGVDADTEQPTEESADSDEGTGDKDVGKKDDKPAPQPEPVAKLKPALLVSRVIDGDTIEVQLKGRTEDIRLIGIDTPETVHPTVGVECFGPAASNFTKERLEGERVRLEYDVEKRDHYGRLLAYVWLDGVMFNKSLVAQGFASVSTYPPNVRYVDRFLDAQRDARSHNKGLWGAVCEPEPEPEEEQPAPVAGGGEGCDPAYPDVCIPSAPPDLNCDDVSHTNIRVVVHPDPHGFDGNNDGIGCES